MPRNKTYLLSLEQLEDRRVLSADALGTLAVPQVPPTSTQAYVSAIEAEARALVQQARVQMQQALTKAESVIQAESARLSGNTANNASAAVPLTASHSRAPVGQSSLGTTKRRRSPSARRTPR